MILYSPGGPPPAAPRCSQGPGQQRAGPRVWQLGGPGKGKDVGDAAGWA